MASGPWTDEENDLSLEWVDAPIPGVQLALAWGDDATGAAWLFKMDPGVALPMQTQTIITTGSASRAHGCISRLTASRSRPCLATIPWSKAASRMPTAATATAPAWACSPSRAPATSRWRNRPQAQSATPGCRYDIHGAMARRRMPGCSWGRRHGGCAVMIRPRQSGRGQAAMRSMSAAAYPGMQAA